MTKNITISIIIVLAIAGAIVAGSLFSRKQQEVVQSVTFNEPVTIFKSPNCGCCGVYISYLSRMGMETKTKNISDAELGEIKKEHGITENLSSCHTSFVAGYVVEGHIPLQVIEKLLEEKPDIKGIALSGMPSGTPGMPGPKTKDWVIYAIANDNTVSEFMRI